MTEWSEVKNGSPALLKNFCFSHPEVREFQDQNHMGIHEVLLAVFYFRTNTSNVGILPYDAVLETIIRKFRPDDWWVELHQLLHPEHIHGSLDDLYDAVDLVWKTQRYLVSRIYIEEATKLWVTDWRRMLTAVGEHQFDPQPNIIFDVLNGDFDRNEARNDVLTYMTTEARVRLDGQPTIFPHIVGPLQNAGLISPDAIQTFQQITDACAELGGTAASFFQFLKALPRSRGVPISPMDFLNEPTELEQLLEGFRG